MKNLLNYDDEKLSILLASDKINASRNAVDRLADGSSEANNKANIPPDTFNRTILIGLGGTGIKTIDYVKRKISEMLDKSWSHYIAFLGIDTDRVEFNNAAKLLPSEEIQITRQDVAYRATHPESYPPAWLRFADPKVTVKLPDLNSDGAGMKRLIGKMKIHDRVSGSKGVDEDIVAKLEHLKNNVLATLAGTGNYEVYVIGSVSGGTCSGGFLEMPSLIRKALGAKNVHIHALLYLPDTLSGIVPQAKAELEANGYASLKELNYYQGLQMRLGYPESFAYNLEAEDTLTIDPSEGFYSIPYLIGTPTGAANNSDKRARETIAEFLISTLGRMVSSGQNAHLVSQFISNAIGHASLRELSPSNPEMEANGAAHEFPKHFAAIGFARAEAPKEIIRAYVTGEACKKAGLKAVPSTERTAMIERGIDLLPFLGPSDYFSPTIGVKKAEQLLMPLLEFMRKYRGVPFSIAEMSDIQTVEWKTIRAGSYDNSTFLQGIINRYVEDHTDVDHLEQLRNDLRKVYQAFRNNVRSYVAQDGPFAFCNLFDGKYDNGGTDTDAVGIFRMMTRLRDGKPYNSDTVSRKESIDDTKMNLDACKTAVMNVSPLDVFGRKQRTSQDWVNAFNAWVNTRVNEVLEENVLGVTGYLQKEFIEPAMLLVEQVRCFGRILDRLSTTYDNLGDNLTHYDAFRNVSDDSTEVNIAAVNMQAHAWLQGQAQKIAQEVEGRKVREKIVDSFFDNTQAWLEFPDDMVVETTGSVSLANPDVGVPAREIFDRCMSETVQVNLNVSIENLFTNVEASGVSYDLYARQIMEELRTRSVILFDGHIDDRDCHRYIMYPSSLRVSNKAIADAIESAAKTIYSNIGFYCSDFADSIMLYQMAMPFEIYRLNQLPSWERQYESMLRKNNNHGMHGRSPDLKMSITQNGTKNYAELTPWQDYPSITFNTDPRNRNPVTGEISHEGTVRIEIDSIIREAKKVGILYSTKDASGKWSISRVFCDKSIDWQFSPDLMLPDSNGLLPMGKDLAEAVATQNGKNLEDISRTVELHQGGLMNMPHATEEWAWTYASRVLYSHRPMLREIRDTLEYFNQWSETIQRFNDEVLRKWKPAKMYRMIQGRVLYPDETGKWIFIRADGKPQMIANLSEDAFRNIARSNPQGAALITEGFTLYYVYTMLMRTPFYTQEAMDEAVARAKAEMEDPKDPELIDESDLFVGNAVETQIAHATDLGINMEKPDRQRQAVLNAMEEKDIEKDTVTDLAVFYSMMKKWKRV